eukprot:614757-Alexandrium_andersonii.AAC.1
MERLARGGSRKAQRARANVLARARLVCGGGEGSLRAFSGWRSGPNRVPQYVFPNMWYGFPADLGH